MQVLLEFGYFCLLFFKFSAGLIRMQVLFASGSLSRIYGILKGFPETFLIFLFTEVF